MADDSLSEFTWIDVDEIHLVGMPANGVPEPLLAKAADAAPNQKGSNKMSKLEKKLRKALGVDLSGGATTAASVQDNDALNALFRQATSHTRSNLEGNRAVKAVIKAFDSRVDAARVELAAAQNEFEVGRAREELRSALKSRFTAKMLIADFSGANKGQFPDSRALFGRGDACTTYSIGDDSQVRGV